MLFIIRHDENRIQWKWEEIKGAKLIEYDFDWAGKNRKNLLDEFSKATKAEVPTK